MVHGSQNRGSWASWGPTIIFSEKKSPYLNNLSLDHIKMNATLERWVFHQIGVTLDSLVFCDHPILSYIKMNATLQKVAFFIRSDICCELDSLIVGDCLI